MLSFETPKLDRIAIHLDEHGVNQLIQALQRLPRVARPQGYRLTDLGCVLEATTPFGEDGATDVVLHFVSGQPR